jgi:hypothetical protein
MTCDDYVRLLNNPLYIDNICKEVFPGMILVWMCFYISGDIFKLVETIVNYVSESSSMTRTFHLEGGGVFSFVNHSPRVDDELHKPNHINFS